MGVVVKGLRYAQNMAHVQRNIKYIGFRSNELATERVREELGLDKTRFFSKDSNNADYKAFIKRIETHKALRHPKSVKMHKLVFSLKEEDFKNYIQDSGGKDFKDLIRATMDKFSKHRGVTLDWIAVTHLTDEDKMSKHPHVHLSIKGVTEQGTRLKLTKEDFKYLREAFDVEFNRVCEYESKWEFGHRQNRKLTPAQQLEKDISNSAKKILKAMERDIEKARYERSKLENQNKRRAKKREIEMELDRKLDRSL